jgi:hypothetical protein
MDSPTDPTNPNISQTLIIQILSIPSNIDLLYSIFTRCSVLPDSICLDCLHIVLKMNI